MKIKKISKFTTSIYEFWSTQHVCYKTSGMLQKDNINSPVLPRVGGNGYEKISLICRVEHANAAAVGMMINKSCVKTGFEQSRCVCVDKVCVTQNAVCQTDIRSTSQDTQLSRSGTARAKFNVDDHHVVYKGCTSAYALTSSCKIWQTAETMQTSGM